MRLRSGRLVSSVTSDETHWPEDQDLGRANRRPMARRRENRKPRYLLRPVVQEQEKAVFSS